MNDADLRTLIDAPERRGEASALELTDAILDRIDGHRELGAYISVTAERARDAAREADQRRARGDSLGPLDGIPVALKDNIDLAGIPATAGSAWFRDRVPRRDAVVARRLRSAGAVIVGKTNMHELAFGATNDNPHFGTCANAWDAARIPGGSSGGSGAALGADLCLAALGTDTGGSVRIPAALNGVTALRPTYGSVSNRGVLPITPSLDTVGAMARSAFDTATVARAIAGYDRHDPYAVATARASLPASAPAGGPLRGLRVAIADGYFFDECLERRSRPTLMPPPTCWASSARARADRHRGRAPGHRRLQPPDPRRGAAPCTRERLARDGDGLGEDVRRRLELGAR